MKNKIMFSIIIPVYNVERYIEKCILSLLDQTYQNFELIVVNDGSPDNSFEICEKMAKNDKRIKLYSKKNGGLSSARNFGIEHSNGNYILFIDSDDYICDKLYLEKIFNLIEKENPDLIVNGVKKYYEFSNHFDNPLVFNYNKDENLMEEMIRTNFFKASASNKILKSEIIQKNNMHFPVGLFSEDIDWCAKIIKNVNLNKVSVLNEAPYVYVQHAGSISKTVGLKNLNDIFNQIVDNCCENIDSYDSNALNSYLAYEYSVLLGLVNTKNCRKKLEKEQIKKIYGYKWLLKFNLSKKVKMVYLLVKFLGIKIASEVLGIFIDLKNENSVEKK